MAENFTKHGNIDVQGNLKVKELTINKLSPQVINANAGFDTFFKHEYLYPTNTMTGFEYDSDGLLKKTVDDGKRYFYSEIVGRKKIVNPMIGGFCGSQRINFDSLQLLDDEIGDNGEAVYSVDGRDWIRAYGQPVMENGTHGHSLLQNTSTRTKIEIITFLCCRLYFICSGCNISKI